MDAFIRFDPAEQQAVSLLAQLTEFAQVTALVHGPGTCLVLGGARSGKSAWAEAQLDGVVDVEYVATSERRVGDHEWEHRVAMHRARRPETWRTTESMDLAEVLLRDDPAPVLVDCIAVWLDRRLMLHGAWDDAPGWREALEEDVVDLCWAVAGTRRDVILVSNEVGSGVVPATASGRLYRDELGRINTRLAATCNEVWTCTAGIARRIK